MVLVSYLAHIAHLSSHAGLPLLFTTGVFDAMLVHGELHKRYHHVFDPFCKQTGHLLPWLVRYQTAVYTLTDFDVFVQVHHARNQGISIRDSVP